jgi:hypothetical protein
MVIATRGFIANGLALDCMTLRYNIPCSATHFRSTVELCRLVSVDGQGARSKLRVPAAIGSAWARPPPTNAGLGAVLTECVFEFVVKAWMNMAGHIGKRCCSVTKARPTAAIIAAIGGVRPNGRHSVSCI